MAEEEKPLVYIGIDFGTTYSGYAYAFRGATGTIESISTKDIQLNYDWPEDTKIFGKYPKTMTALYYRDDKDVEPLWGWPAFKAAMSDKNLQKWQFQHRFKLRLAGGNVVDESLPPLPPHRTREQVITDFVRALANYALESITKHSPYGVVKHKYVQWCLTVPATWQQGARVAMERVAQAAGLIRASPEIDNGGSVYPFRIVLEPEAASVFCYNYLSRQNQALLAKVNEGAPYLIVDCGGGTVDLAVHARTGQNGLREMSPGSGDLCGGTYVDQEFFKVIRAKFPKFEDWTKKQVAMFFKLLLSWEGVKREFSGLEKVKISCDFPKAINKLFPDPTIQFDDDEDEESDAIFTVEQFAAFFEPIIAKIVRLIEDQLAKVPTTHCILLVGGFSSSKYLQRRVLDVFKTRLPVYGVSLGAESIACGAVLLGLSPDWFKTRCMKRTYGFQVAKESEKGDPPESIQLVKGRRMCTTRFEPYATINQEIPINHVISKRLVPDRFDMDCTMSLYASNAPNVRMVNEKGVELVQKIVIPLVKNPGFGQNGLMLDFFFGKTVMEMIVRDSKTGKELPVIKLDFFDQF